MTAPLDRRWIDLLVAGGSALTAAAMAWAARDHVPGGPSRWRRTNHRGEALTLLEGPAWTAGALTGVALAPRLEPRVRAAAFLAVGSAAVLGAVDDLTGTSDDRGLRGHLGAMARGRLTTGGLKVLGIGATGVAVAAALLPARVTGRRGLGGAVDVVLAGGVVAGAANLVNLLDLRPGRALKVALLPAPLVLVGGPAAAPLLAVVTGASTAVLPVDLGERGMLGDSGANAAGALLGAALVAGTAASGGRGRAVRAAVLGVLVVLTLASERVSFTAVVEGTPVLRGLDRLGRRPRSGGPPA